MSELAQVQAAIEAAQKNTAELFEAQRKQIGETGEVSKQLTADLAKVQEDMKAASQRMFDLEQKAAGFGGDLEAKKGFAEDVAEKAMAGWDGKSATVAVKSFAFANKALGSGAASAGALVVPDRLPGIMMPGLRRLTIRQLMAQGRTGSNSIEYVRENVFTNGAAPVAEGALKPESQLTFTKETANVRTIAHWIQASRQIMDDAQMLESYVNGRLMYGLALKEEDQLLSGDGTGDNLLGVNAVASAYDVALDVVGDTRADKLAHAIFQVTESEFEASGVVLNPRDWHQIALLKDENGNYIFGGPQAFASNLIWGLPVVPTKAQALGTFTTGAFDMASQVWDRMDASVEISREDRDNFVKNMLTILCEERLALTHYRPSALIKGTF